MFVTRAFTVVDTSGGAVVYRFDVANLRELVQNLLSLDLAADCAQEVASAAWRGSLVVFRHVPLVVLPGRSDVLTPVLRGVGE